MSVFIFYIAGIIIAFFLGVVCANFYNEIFLEIEGSEVQKE